MTRKDAIENLRILLNSVENKEAEETFKMAIKSLEVDEEYCLAYEDAKAAGPWIDVDVDDPDIGQDVLVCDIDGDIYKGYLSGYDGWRRSEDFEKIKSAVAWMPLPEPYKGAE